MKLELVRDTFTETSTTGSLFVDDVYECFTLEDRDRKLENGGAKVYGQSAIPRGRYKVELDWSPKHSCDVPHILDVPQFQMIEIHWGNSADDTEGCVLVGQERSDNWIRNSKLAWNSLMQKLKLAWANGEEVWITIT